MHRVFTSGLRLNDYKSRLKLLFHALDQLNRPPPSVVNLRHRQIELGEKVEEEEEEEEDGEKEEEEEGDDGLQSV